MDKLNDKVLDFTINADNETVSFVLYNKFNIIVSIEDWHFLCENRWFSKEPYKDEVEAEFGLYGARNAETSEDVLKCIKSCVEDLKDVMETDIRDKCSILLDSNISTLLTIDKDGNLMVKEESNEYS